VHKSRVAFITTAAILGIVGTLLVSAQGEVLRVRAIDRVSLYDPQSLAGAHGTPPLQLGNLEPGYELKVSACVDRKTDINIHAVHQGRELAVGEWHARVELLRRRAFIWEDGATMTCRGFFRSISRDA
jgi:hypothetical protein